MNLKNNQIDLFFKTIWHIFIAKMRQHIVYACQVT